MLDAARRLGPYEIVSLIGAGAMGQVYRARDVRLNRDVAVKVLSPALASDPAAMARFEREARAVAALSHPNIIALYDIGRDGDTAYVVTELLDGVSMRERLASGPLPVRKATEYARQIAVALASAHERGIVHRDLKPENVMLTGDGRVKVLDFGLAHVASAAVPGGPGSVATTVETSPGTLFGTIGYMAPEQARAQSADHRSDIFALGATLYEMLTGRRAFTGDTPADTIAALLNAESPRIESLEGVPPQLERLVYRCLEKNPSERFQSARDLAFALEQAPAERGQSGTAQAPARGGWWPWAAGAGGLLLAAAGAIAMVGTRASPGTPPQVVRFGIPANMTWSDAASVSPDGKWIVYTGGTSADQASGVAAGRFWLRAVDSLRAVRLPDTESAVALFFWSPDSRLLGYRAGNALMVRPVPTGQPSVLVDLPSTPQGVAWSAQGDLIIAMAGGLYRMRAAGGTPQLLFGPDPSREISKGWPAFLPDGQRFLFTAVTNGSGEQALETRAASLDGRELGTVTKGVAGAMFADGYLLFGAGGTLYAQEFDPDRLVLSGERIEVATGVVQDWRTGHMAVAASRTGLLVFRGAHRDVAHFTVVDRVGRVRRTVGAPDSFDNFSVSPDERNIVATRRDPKTGQAALWLIDMVRGVTSLVTDANDTLDADDPTWAPDGQQIAYRHGNRLVIRPVHGGTERTVVDAEAFPDSFSRDGRYLVYGRPNGNAFEQWAIDLLTPGADPLPLVTGITLADEGRVSPDGKWVAYHANPTGVPQVYVMPLPASGQKWQLSQAGGVQPRWSVNGQELVYLDPDGRLMSVALPGADPRRALAPKALFTTGLSPSDAIDQIEPLKDGFLLRMPRTAAADAAAVQVMLNWRPR